MFKIFGRKKMSPSVKVLCDKCGSLLANSGVIVNRDFAGHVVKCMDCNAALRETISIHLADFQVKPVCPKCYKKNYEGKIKCYKCEDIYSKR